MVVVLLDDCQDLGPLGKIAAWVSVLWSTILLDKVVHQTGLMTSWVKMGQGLRFFGLAFFGKSRDLIVSWVFFALEGGFLLVQIW